MFTLRALMLNSDLIFLFFVAVHIVVLNVANIGFLV